MYLFPRLSYSGVSMFEANPQRRRWPAGYVLFAGFGSLLVLMGVVGVDALRMMSEAKTSNLSIRGALVSPCRRDPRGRGWRKPPAFVDVRIRGGESLPGVDHARGPPILERATPADGYWPGRAK